MKATECRQFYRHSLKLKQAYLVLCNGQNALVEMNVLLDMTCAGIQWQQYPVLGQHKFQPYTNVNDSVVEVYSEI